MIKLNNSDIAAMMVGSTAVDKVMVGSTEVWSNFVSPSNKYFYTQSLEDGNTITLTIGSNVSTTELEYIEYSIDNGSTWVKTDNVSSQFVTISVENVDTDDIVLWRGVAKQLATGSTYNNFSESYISVFSSTKTTSAGGNVMSLLYGSNFKNKIEFPQGSQFAFSCLFYGWSNLVGSAHDVILPATTLTSNCYVDMFRSSSVTESPTLPALTLAADCYKRMFKQCSQLSKVRMYATDITATNCLSNWMDNTASTGDRIFYKNKQATWTGNVPTGWTVELVDVS